MKYIKRLVLVILGISVLALGARLAAPTIVESKLHQKAQTFGLQIHPKFISVEFDKIILDQVSISSPFFPNQKVFFKQITVKLDWVTPKSIHIDGGDIKLQGKLETLESQFDNWRNRNGEKSPRSGSDGPSLKDKIFVEDISLYWNNLEAHGVSFKNNIILAKSIDTVISNRRVQIVDAKYNSIKPTEVSIGKIHLTPVKSNSDVKPKSRNLRIPSIPEIPLTTIRIGTGLIIHDNFIIKTKQAILGIDQGELLGINLEADRIDINKIFLTKLNLDITINIGNKKKEARVQLSAASLRFSHPVLLNQEIEVKRPDIHLEATIKPDRYQVKNSWVRINKTTFNVEGSYDSEWIRGRVSMSRTPCQDLLNSVPSAMKTTINGMEFDGDMAWEIHGEIDIPSKTHTSIGVKLTNNCKIIKVPDYLSVDRFQGKFKRFVYDAKNELVEIESGPGTVGWTPVGLVSMFVPITFRTMEDPSFMVHHGFDIQAIENSIRDNIKTGKFIRGASTITMQLAKNLWLHRDKTLSRKVQEAFLTMYLEQELDKSKIMELYVNVVEFGPDIYGIGPASKRYFKKHPSKLTFGQAMFLASILPKPKSYYFDADGELVPSKLKFLHRAMKAMRDKKIISENEYQQGIKEVIKFGQSSTTNEEELNEPVEVGEEGLNPNSWDTN